MKPTMIQLLYVIFVNLGSESHGFSYSPRSR